MALAAYGSLIGRTIGNFVIERKIGEGGMGEVYLAAHPRLNRKVAVKVLHSAAGARPELAQRFYNEARAATDVKSPHIVEVLDFGELAEGLPYLVMEWLDGRSLGDLIGQGRRLSVPEALHVLDQTCAALSAAHAVGIVHRDLKPDNIFITSRQGDLNHVKVLDFGIAKLANDDGNLFKTTTGALMGTPAYMSPEQCRGLKNLDGRSDIYSLGVIAFQMLTGHMPFVAEGWGDLILLHVSAPPPHPCDVVPELPRQLASVILKALEKSPADRFATASEFAAALRAAVPATGGVGSIIGQEDLRPRTVPLLKPTAILPAAHASTPVPSGLRPRGNTTLEGRELVRTSGGKTSRTWVIGGMTIAGLSIVLAMALLWPRKRPEPARSSQPPIGSAAMERSQAAPEVQPTLVRFRLRTVPPHARITLDGQVVAAPVDSTFARSTHAKRLVVSAPGRKTVERTITLDTDQDLVIELEPDVAPRQPAAKPQVRAARGPRPQETALPSAPVVEAEAPSPAPRATTPPSAPPAATVEPAAPPQTGGRPVYRGTRLPLEKDF